MDYHALLNALRAHQAADETESAHLKRIISFVEQHTNCCSRDLTIGHVTASSWIVNDTGSHALLTHHRKLDRWLQLGGHIENDQDIITAALREAREESGLEDIHTVSETIFDVDVHPIPARKTEPEHFHYDVRFLFQASHSDQLLISDESHDLGWFTIQEMQTMSFDDSIVRMINKMIALR